MAEDIHSPNLERQLGMTESLGAPSAESQAIDTAEENVGVYKFLTLAFVFLTMIFTGFAACSTGKQATIASDQERRALRAYVGNSGFQTFHGPFGPEGKLGYMTWPQWKNFGNTPTRHLVMETHPAILSSSPIYAFDFKPTYTAPAATLLVPQQEDGGSPVFIRTPFKTLVRRGLVDS